MESFYLYLLKHPETRKRSQWTLEELKDSIETMIRYLAQEHGISEWPFNRQSVLELLTSMAIPVVTFFLQNVL